MGRKRTADDSSDEEDDEDSEDREVGKPSRCTARSPAQHGTYVQRCSVRFCTVPVCICKVQCKAAWSLCAFVAAVRRIACEPPALALTCVASVCCVGALLALFLMHADPACCP